MSVETQDVRAHRLWWQLLLHRVEQVRAALPAQLQGVIQFEVETDQGPQEHFYLQVRGPLTTGYAGRSEAPRATVRTREWLCADLLLSEEIPLGALRVSGDVGFFDAVMRAVAGVPKTKSWLETRSAR